MVSRRVVKELIGAQHTEQYLAHSRSYLLVNYFITCTTCAYFSSQGFLTLWSTQKIHSEVRSEVPEKSKGEGPFPKFVIT